MAVLQSSSRCAETTVIVMGDHSWRLGLWGHQGGWTREDEQASRGSLIQVLLCPSTWPGNPPVLPLQKRFRLSSYMV
jgi:hypothetical protein